MDLDPPPMTPPAGSVHARRAAVVGSPVSHSRSPDLHLAAYRALGLSDWRYERIDCDATGLPALVAGLPDEFVGLSVTMPGKVAALAVAGERTDRAELVGSANTLVRTERGWRADCTDIDGMTGALREVLDGAARTDHAVVLGAGGTARPALAALAAAGFTSVTVIARDEGRAADAIALAHRLSLSPGFLVFETSPALREACTAADVVVSTVPAAAAAPVAADVAGTAHLVDVIYNPWPTPLATAVADRGGRVVGGLVMLLNQAYSQVEQFTGRPAPRAAMAAALGHTEL
ncbi:MULTISPECIES: shikimate dehydrogenase [unclassified Gordonia (in: high G+C Gram-positive bacteria)]